MNARTIIDRFDERVRAHPDESALRHRVAGVWTDVTWRDYGRLVELVARGLLALGLTRGERMCLLASNRPEWFFADVACLSLGATTAPIYTSSSPDQVAHVLGHSQARIAVVEDREQLAKIEARRAQLPGLQKVVVMSPEEASGDFASWDDLLAAGDRTDPVEVRRLRARLGPEDTATFVYTSGTTGLPKAVMLTHANIWSTCESLDRHLQMGDAARRTLSYLPLSHIGERMVSHLLQIYFGAQTWFVGSVENLRDDLRDCRPTYFFAVPRVWEKFHAVVRSRMTDRPATPRQLLEQVMLRRAMGVGRRVVEAEQAAVARGQTINQVELPRLLRVQHAMLERIVLSQARARAGLDECTRTFCAAAPIDPEILRFFHALGLRIAEGYGQSETSGPTTWNPPDANRIGTVGTPIPGLELRLADDGEILVRGANVTPGYFEDPEATGALFDPDGWMRSGDIGALDDLGYLSITDRKKDLIITAGGKNVAPQELENAIKAEEFVSQAVVVGDGRPFLTALVTLDEDRALAWATERGLPADLGAIARDGRIHARIQSAVAELNARLARAETIKKFRVLERDFSQEEDEITPTLKVKRRRVGERYAQIIDEMYEPGSPVAAAASTASS